MSLCPRNTRSVQRSIPTSPNGASLVRITSPGRGVVRRFHFSKVSASTNFTSSRFMKPPLMLLVRIILNGVACATVGAVLFTQSMTASQTSLIDACGQADEKAITLPPTAPLHSPQSGLPVLSPLRLASPVLRSTPPAALRIRSHPPLVPPLPRTGPDSGSSPAPRCRQSWRPCTTRQYLRTCPSESFPSSTSGSRRRTPQLHHGTAARCWR